jgi:hypothetical protein
MFFEDKDPISVHTLACAAREITSGLGTKMKIETVLDDYAKASGRSRKKAEGSTTRKANFMKHADHDPDATLEFDESENDMILFLACHDFGRIAKGMPIEAQVYELWHFATHVKKLRNLPPSRQKAIKACIKAFPNVRSASRKEQKAVGLRVLEKCLADPSLGMEIQRIVALPKEGS